MYIAERGCEKGDGVRREDDDGIPEHHFLGALLASATSEEWLWDK